MSEALENSIRQLGEAFVIVTADERFSHSLEKFYNDASRRALGGRALTLYGDRHLRIVEEPLPDEMFERYPDMTSKKRLSAIQTDLRHRTHDHPSVLPDVKFARDTALKGDTEEHPGIRLHFAVSLERPLVQALQNSLFLNSDGSLPLHHTIARVDMSLGEELLEARDALREAVESRPPLGVTGLHISSDIPF